MKEYTLTLRLEASWTEEVTITLPDGLTESDLEELVDEAITLHVFAGPDDSEIETCDIDWSEEYQTADEPQKQTFQELEEYAFEFEGRHYLSDGIIIIRDDVPVNMLRQERLPNIVKHAEEAVKILESSDRSFARSLWVGNSYKPIFDMTEKLVFKHYRNSYHTIIECRAANGAILACVMPMREKTPDSFEVFNPNL